MYVSLINFSREKTLNTGNYENTKVGVSMSITLEQGDHVDSCHSALVSLVDEKLGEEINKLKNTNNSQAYQHPENECENLPSPTIDPYDPSLDIRCELCGAKMVLRKGSKGYFWGCSSFGTTNCKGIISIKQVQKYLTTGKLGGNR